MAKENEEQTEEQKASEEKEKEKAEAEKKLAEEKDESVAYATYDKAMKTVAKRGEENKALTEQLAEMQKKLDDKDNAEREVQKTASPDKYYKTLEEENTRLKNDHASLLETHKQEIESRNVNDTNREKLSVFWEFAQKEGMVDDKAQLSFVNLESIVIDDNGINKKSVQHEVNRMKKEKSYLFNVTPTKINGDSPKGDETKEPKTLFEQLEAQIKPTTI